MSNLIIKKRKVPEHVFNFYGDLKTGYFTINDIDDSFFSSSINLDQKLDEVVWILVPRQLSTGRLIAWPNYKGSRLKYHEFEEKE